MNIMDKIMLAVNCTSNIAIRVAPASDKLVDGDFDDYFGDFTSGFVQNVVKVVLCIMIKISDTFQRHGRRRMAVIPC